MKIDIHGHVLSRDTMGQAGPYGPEVDVVDGWLELRMGEHVERARVPEGTDATTFLENFGNPDLRVRQLDERGVDYLGVTTSPLFYMYWAEPEIGVHFSRVQNDALAKFPQSHPDRFFLLATLPLQDIDASLTEFDRAVGDLGARGINLGSTNIAGRELDDEALWPLYAS